MKFLSGLESTHIFGTGKDVLELTRHTEHYAADLRLAQKCGLEQMRYSVPWHKVERVPGTYDWTWMDGALGYMRSLAIDPILDPLHHTSFPQWLEGGFANANFAKLYEKFVAAIAERYPWARNYTVINEPFVTTWFCGHEGRWYPYYKGADSFVPMLMNVVEAIVSVSRMLVASVPDVKLIHVEAAEKHRAIDAPSQAHAEFGNNMRFLIQDMILGRVDDNHPLFGYLTDHGVRAEQLARFREQPARIDILGLDYYSHCELEWGCEGRILPNRTPEGLVPTALEYAERYRLPIMLSETNIRGFVSDRISWLKFMAEQCEEIERRTRAIDVPFEGFCWYPFIDSTDWCSLVTKARGCIDPQGIIWLDRSYKRNTSELSEVYTALATGKMTAADVPAYRFQAPVDEQLQGFLPMMAHWAWQDPFGRHKRRPALRRLAPSLAARRRRDSNDVRVSVRV
jgi:beta-glucosidase/6-phospho-beta-glucosidase/beta-galactosidase